MPPPALDQIDSGPKASMLIEQLRRPLGSLVSATLETLLMELVCVVSAVAEDGDFPHGKVLLFGGMRRPARG
jgi:hypothetical protein